MSSHTTTGSVPAVTRYLHQMRNIGHEVDVSCSTIPFLSLVHYSFLHFILAAKSFQKHSIGLCSIAHKQDHLEQQNNECVVQSNINIKLNPCIYSRVHVPSSCSVPADFPLRLEQYFTSDTCETIRIIPYTQQAQILAVCKHNHS